MLWYLDQELLGGEWGQVVSYQMPIKPPAPASLAPLSVRGRQNVTLPSRCKPRPHSSRVS